jgi:RHS repeat-associated protein
LFSYKTRVDKNSTSISAGYHQYCDVNSNSLLDKIEIKTEDDILVKTYQFLYANDGLYSLLQEVKEIGNDNGNSIEINSTILKYGKPKDILDYNTTPPLDFIVNTTSSTNNIVNPKADVLTADFDGDGINELVFLNYTISYGLNWLYNKIYTGIRIMKKNANTNNYDFAYYYGIPYIYKTALKHAEIIDYTIHTTINIGDYNGDGKLDIALDQYEQDAIVNNFWTDDDPYLRASSKHILNNTSSNGSNTFTFEDNNIYNNIVNPNNVYIFGDEFNQTIYGDFNGDGKNDVIKNYRNSNSSNFDVKSYLQLSNLNTNFNEIISLGSILNGKKILGVNDFDGDGKSDILLDNNFIVSVFYDDAIGKYNIKYEDSHISSINKDKLHFGDFNGDGKIDILTKLTTDNNNLWRLNYSTGNNSVFKEKIINLALDNLVHKTIVSDFNGDSKSDILQFTTNFATQPPTTNLNFYFSNGIDFIAQWRGYNNNLDYYPQFASDLNGDGASEVILQSYSAAINTQPFKIFDFGNNYKERLLRKVKDGFNNTTEFVYDNITKGNSVYSPTVLSNYPVISRTNPMYVISEVKESNGVGGVNSTNYIYEGLQMHIAGKGLLGFRGISKINNTDGFTTRTVSNLNANFLYQYYFACTFPNGANESQYIYKETYSNSTKDFGNKRFLPILNTFASVDKIKGKSYTKQNTYDNIGNITNTVEDINSGVETTNTTFSNFIANGSPLATKAQDKSVSIARSGSTYMKNTRTNYYANGDVLNVIDFFNTSKSLTTSFEYDKFGNIIKSNTSGLSNGSTISILENMQYFPNGRILNTYEIPNLASISTNLSYDKKWSMPTSTTTKEGRHNVTNVYDAFGRLTRTTPSVATGNTPYDITNALNWSTKYNSIYSLTTQIGNQSPSITYFDALKRVVGEEKTVNSKLTFTQNIYNTKGDLWITKTNDANGSIITVTNSYDNYHRLTSSFNDVTNSATSLSYSLQPITLAASNLMITKSVTEKPLVKTTYDGTDNVIKVEESADGSTVTNEYTYHACGKIANVKQGATNLITNTIDSYGDITQTVDANAGTFSYEYDAFKNITKQTDARNNITELRYDYQNRLSEKKLKDNSKPSFPPNTTSYNYNGSTGLGAGELNRIIYNDYIEPSMNIIDQFVYDEFDRLKTSERAVDGRIYTTEYGYGEYDRINKIIYPSASATITPITLKYSITNDGFITKVTSDNNGANLKNIFITNNIDYNHYGLITKYTLGNGRPSEIKYNALGLPIQYVTKLPILFNPALQDLKLDWNLTTGNLKQRIDASARQNKPAFTENFTYDKFDRLKSTQTIGFTSNPPLEIAYTPNGNISKKYDAGTEYKYKTNKINAVEYIKAGVYNSPTPPDRTDISTETQTIDYNAYNQPSLITEGAGTSLVKELKYFYDYTGQRVKSVYKENGSIVTTRTYIGEMEFETNGTNITRQLSYISTPQGLASINLVENNTSNYFYTYTDHLGSILHVTNDNLLYLFDQNFDAWGRQRNPINWNYTGLPAQPVQIYRGYTGHEHVSKFNLINMNGRMYDPIVGRMLSPDIVVHDPYNTQHYNKYSYTWNNPLRFTRPIRLGSTCSYTRPMDNWLTYYYNNTMGCKF